MFEIESVTYEPGSVEYVMLNPFATAAISDVNSTSRLEELLIT